MKKISDFKIKNFQNLYIKGFSLREISRIEKVSPNTVKKYLLLKKVNVKTKNIIYSLKNKDNLLIGLYCGIWAGDGTQYLDKGYRIKICCHAKDKLLIKFIQKIIFQLFEKTSYVAYEERNRAQIRFDSKFIYNFVNKYLIFKKNKSYSVCLKKEINNHSLEFIEGFFLGLMLSDGYLKNRLRFNSISKKLVKNLYSILEQFSFSPKIYIHDRRKYGWKNLYMLSLIKKESNKANQLLNEILIRLNKNISFRKLKGYKKR